MEEAFLHCHRQWFPRLILMNLIVVAHIDGCTYHEIAQQNPHHHLVGCQCGAELAMDEEMLAPSLQSSLSVMDLWSTPITWYSVACVRNAPKARAMSTAAHSLLE